MMTCDEIRESLFSAEQPDAAVVEHLQSCAACRELAAKMKAVETMVRSVPTPPEAARSQASFLQLLSPTVPAPHRRRVMASFGWATTAGVLLAVGVTAFLLAPSRETQAQTHVVDALVEWNLQLSETNEPDERERLHRDRLPQLQQAVRTAKLSPREQNLANQLLDHGEWLARNDDPLDAAERFQDLADAVLVLMEETTAEPRESEQYAVYVSKLNDRGVEANMARAARHPAPDAARQAKTQRVAKKQQRHEAKLEALAAKLPEAAREKALARKKNAKSAKSP
jgi:hypothetical protein